MDHDQYRDRLAATHAGSERFFPKAEFTRRRQKVAAAMEVFQLDALLVTDAAEIYYLTGYKTFEVSVHTALIFRPDHCLLQVPSIEMGPAVTTALVNDITGYHWEAVTSVVDPLVKALESASSIGYSPWGAGLRPGLIKALKARLGDTRFREAGELLKRPVEEGDAAPAIHDEDQGIGVVDHLLQVSSKIPRLSEQPGITERDG